ncbi:f-box domain containing protein [Niveomyces insectorum RCEF 264]|uniref:F-box domain containing protein n=1 Tax=Niveomyces insectorum RCEF 264 TaxID=1081102 RepID=A0A167RGK6_9HYPO|nr:f-box domain containing protein [Niveomyces insectorum RCEF 264]
MAESQLSAGLAISGDGNGGNGHEDTRQAQQVQEEGHAEQLDQFPQLEHASTSQPLQDSQRSQPAAAADGMADAPPRWKGRQRLFRGLSRMSSSPSLAPFGGRARSSSTPYTRSGASLSCISLASTSSPFSPTPSSAASSGFAFSPLASPAMGGAATDDYPSSSTSLASPPTSFPRSGSPSNGGGGDDDGNGFPVRKVDLSYEGAGSGKKIPVPVDVVRVSSSPWSPPRPKKSFFQRWELLPHEIKVHIFGFFRPKELVRFSRVNRAFYKACFDGQLWTRFDASEFYQDIPAESLSKIITAAGPFVRDLNLRGCIQIEKYQDAINMTQACNNLVNATLEGSHLSFHNLEALLKRNPKLAHINLTGLACVNLNSCVTISDNCTQLEVLNLSWCKNATAKGVAVVLKSCPKLRDLRVGEVRGFDSLEVAETIFKTNRLERFILSGCDDLTDPALCAMLHGLHPEIDLLTDRPKVPPRRLRHLDLSRCQRLTNRGVAALGYCVPDLEGLVLSGCSALTDAALEPILASTPRLAFLDLEDLTELTDHLLSEHLTKAPCAERLKHLSVSYCENIGDTGVLPAVRACKNLRSVDMDNTRISDLVLAEAAAMVRTRAARTRDRGTRPYVGLSMAVYDCPNVTWTGVREVLSRNAEILMPRSTTVNGQKSPALATFPTEIIALKCFYGWQMTVDEHIKRVLRGDFAAAARLERKWADYMQANEEAGTGGAGNRRRRRRAREAQQVHADEEEGGVGDGGVGAVAGLAGTPTMGIGRRRARTATCAVM